MSVSFVVILLPVSLARICVNEEGLKNVWNLWIWWIMILLKSINILLNISLEIPQCDSQIKMSSLVIAMGYYLLPNMLRTTIRINCTIFIISAYLCQNSLHNHEHTIKMKLDLHGVTHPDNKFPNISIRCQLRKWQALQRLHYKCHWAINRVQCRWIHQIFRMASDSCSQMLWIVNRIHLIQLTS